MTSVPLVGTNINFGLNYHPSGKKVPFIAFVTGDGQFTVLFNVSDAENLAKGIAAGIMQVAEVARQANGGLIVPQVNVDLSKLNGGQST